MSSSRPVDRRKPYVRIADDLRREIAAGQHPVGELLPSAGELAEKYGVAKMTISNAIAVLRDEGLVSTKQGSRSTVIATPEEATAGPVPGEPSEEFKILSAQLQEIRAQLRRLGSKLDELDERTRKG